MQNDGLVYYEGLALLSLKRRNFRRQKLKSIVNIRTVRMQMFLMAVEP